MASNKTAPSAPETTTQLDTPPGPPPMPPNVAPIDYDRMGAAIGGAVAQGIAAGTRRKVTIGEYIARGGNSAFHPDPNVRTKFTPGRFYLQNGKDISFDTSTDKEVLLLNRITHSGRYIDRLVEVIVTQVGADEETVNIRFSNKRDEVVKLAGKARDFEHMLEQIVAAQEEEDAEAAEIEENRQTNRRHFGAGKASVAARKAKAGN